MGKLTEYLLGQVLKQLDQSGIVVWYDAAAEYALVVDALTDQGVTVRRYSGSFFALRRAIEPLVAEEPRYDVESKRIVSPRLVIYLPLSRDTTYDAMIEAEKTGAVLEPGAPAGRNSRLEVVTRAALRYMPAEMLEQIVKSIGSGTLHFADVERRAEQGAGGPLHLEAVFGPGEPHLIALRFLTHTGVDATLEAKGAVPELLAMLRTAFGFEGRPTESTAELRTRLTRHVFLGALASELPAGARWPPLEALPVPATLPHRAACGRVAEAWRDSERLSAGYREAAGRVQTEYHLDAGDTPANVFQRVDTFPFAEPRLLQAAGVALREGQPAKALSLARERLARFWTRTSPEVGLRWAFVDSAARLLMEADRIEDELARAPESVDAFVRCYAEGGAAGTAPWCVLDHLHRSAARLYSDLDADGTVELIARLLHTRYAAVVDRMTRAFSEKLLATGAGSTPRQSDVFRRNVEPRLGEEKVAYVLVDALRFEMARELAGILGEGYATACTPVLAIAPTVTVVGMAALCPGAHKGLTLAEKNDGVVLLLEGVPLRDRKDRIQYIRSQSPGRTVDLYLKDLQKPTRSVQSTVRGATLVIVTSQEIDKFAEQGEDDHARAVMEGVLLQMKRAVRNLVGLGVERIVMTADHGFLFGDALTSEMSVNPPGGRTLALHRRVWIGRGGSAGESCVYRTAGDLGLGGDLEFAFPVSTAVFRGPGSRSYFHGGLSLQEMVVPVLTVKATTTTATPRGAAQFHLSMDRLRITSRLFSVAVEFEPDLLRSGPVVRCVARAGGKEVAQVVAAEYGLREGTREIELGYAEAGAPRRNVVTLMFDGEPHFAHVSIHLLDADTQAEVARLDRVVVAVTI